MLSWLALSLECNAERNKMQMNPRLASNHSFFVSLDTVLLRLCDPFLEPLSGKAWGKVDAGWGPSQLNWLGLLTQRGPGCLPLGDSPSRSFSDIAMHVCAMRAVRAVPQSLAFVVALPQTSPLCLTRQTKLTGMHTARN